MEIVLHIYTAEVSDDEDRAGGKTGWVRMGGRMGFQAGGGLSGWVRILWAGQRMASVVRLGEVVLGGMGQWMTDGGMEGRGGGFV